jgi:hypothetical protein
MGDSGKAPVLTSLEATLEAIGSVVLPTPEALDPDGWRRAREIIEEALAPKPSKIKRQLRLFLRVVNVLPLPTTGRTLRGLSVPRRTAFLEGLHRSRIQLLRKGLWGVRTLIFMGYYNQPSVRKAIGYAADPKGWESLGSVAGPTGTETVGVDSSRGRDDTGAELTGGTP